MRCHHLTLSAAVVVIAGFLWAGPGAEATDLSLHANGSLCWTNENTNAVFTLEWSPNLLTGPWRVWDSYRQAPVTSAITRIDVPMYFRVAVETNLNCFVPPEGKILVMIGQDTNSIYTYTAANGIKPGGVMFYTSIQNAEGLTNRSSKGGGPQFGQHLADTYSNSVIQIGLYMVGVLENVFYGSYDQNIEKLGRWIADTHRPVYLRIGYEFDADWANYDPVHYVEAYRYIVDHFNAMGVSNAAYVWHSYAAGARYDLMEWYPGDEYVDWIGASLFASPLSGNRAHLIEVAELARSLKKPLMLAEASPHGISATNGAVSWGGWFDPVFDFIREYDVKALCYINCNWDAPEMWQFNTLGWHDARIQQDAVVQSLWTQKMAHAEFLHASTNLFKQLGYSEAP